MRFLVLIFFIVSTLYTSADTPLKIGVITDTHFLSTKLMDNKYAIQSEVYKYGRNFMAAPEILDQVVKDYGKSDIDILLVCGDLTKDGEKESHLEFRDRLRPLYQKGVKIFVIPGNHDINMPYSVGFRGNETYKAENITPIDFAEIYQDYGYKNTVDRDSSSLSYVTELDETTWLLAIDAARYDEFKEHAITAGKIKQETENWIISTLASAQEAGKQVIAMMHWGVAEHMPMQAKFFSAYLVDEHKRIANLLADNGVQLIFTGHFHSNDISKHVSEKGNTIYDIETGTLASYPFAYRFIELNKESVNIKTKNITSTISEPDLVETNKKLMRELATRLVRPMLKNKVFDFNDDQLERMAKIAGQLFVIHLAGDEVVDEATKKEIASVFLEMDFPVDETLTNMDLDLAPQDNNLIIYFNNH